MLGCICELFRIETLNMSRAEFSKATGLTVSQIRHFEQGRSTNMNILQAYLVMGMPLDVIVHWVETGRVYMEVRNNVK